MESASMKEYDPVEPIGRSLGMRIKPPDAFDIVTEEVKSHRKLGPWREHVNDAAPPGDSARLLNDRYNFEPDLQRPFVKSLN
jgi:hypothetical protein